MKVLSLFDGMSVAQQALKDAGIPVEVYYASEIDPYAIAVTASNFPNTIQLGSVTDVKGETDIDLLIGGSPCQDLSIAKKNREGLKGERSGLFYEYVRIRDENMPEYFILENVASMPKEAKEQISEILGVQPVMINASLVSAQNRKRLFWVGKWNGEKYEQVEISQPEDRGILLKDIIETGENVVYQDTYKRLEGKPREHQDKCFTLTSAMGTGGGHVPYVDRLKSYCIDANYWKGTNLEHYLKKGVRQIVFSSKNRRTNVKVLDEKSETLTSSYRGLPDGDGRMGVVQNDFIRKLTPTECLRLQSMPDDYFDKAEYKGKPISNTQRYKMCGNAFNEQVIVHILKYLV